ncbi:cupin domain-containing protein [Mucilaginibacter xinganensis]|uniref:Cupin 2 conserved barrel domain-containing protein n=1 Tax=Mucilaginibacter xinganensis TaxID=1234841 RepID=A0A223NTM1_9SPHI|nr:hypothetical protein [Mucilaginibacter xinganensis]ASU33120.1 hypothetical protein MuYL_1220 [Mucilaginibacter xinganensis]
METFKVTRVFADKNGDSQFEDIIYPLINGGPIGYLSGGVKVKELIFRRVSPAYDDFHNAPERQYVVLLDGGVEIENSLGEKRMFAAGEILLMEDVTGKGHRSRNLKKAARNSLFITLTD